MGGSCLPSNGIALAKEFSMAFIQGKFTLSEQYEIVVHPNNDIKVLEKYRYKQMRVPPNSFFHPDKNSLKYHREHIYGLFSK